MRYHDYIDLMSVLIFSIKVHGVVFNVSSQFVMDQ